MAEMGDQEIKRKLFALICGIAADAKETLLKVANIEEQLEQLKNKEQPTHKANHKEIEKTAFLEYQ